MGIYALKLILYLSMKKLLTTILLLNLFFCVYAQEKTNIADLDFFYQELQKTPSFKDQLKSDKSYPQLYEKLKKELNTDDEFEVFQKLVQLVLPLRDNHLGFYRTPDSTFNFKKTVPLSMVTSLQKKYEDLPLDSLEGIYHNGKLDFILYKLTAKTYQMVSLADGSIKNLFFKNHYGSYDVIQLVKSPYSFVLTRSISLRNGLLVGLPFYKGDGKSFYNVLTRKQNYEYKVLANETGYLSLGTFSSSDKTIKEATDFFNQIRPAITAKTLIVDIRNNGGGGFKNSMQFISFLKNFNGKIYILQNGFTVSNAEQFILKLKEKANVVTLGETTKGMITYGSNYGSKILLPSKRFTFYPTDMSGSKKELAFEGIGIKPDVELNYKQDWVEQTITYIKNN